MQFSTKNLVFLALFPYISNVFGNRIGVQRHKRSTLGLTSEYVGKQFRFYSYDSSLCLHANGDYVVTGSDCNDPSAMFIMSSTLTEDATGQQFEALKFHHIQTGQCLGHDVTGLLALVECQPCCDALYTQDWLQHGNSFRNYYQIESTSGWGTCLDGGTGPQSLGSALYLQTCSYYDNPQWWSLWAY